MLVDDARGDHMKEAYSRTCLLTALYVVMSVSFCLPHPVLCVLLSFVVACELVLDVVHVCSVCEFWV